MVAGAGVPCALESELLLESQVKVLEEEERPSDLMGDEELLALLRLREEETEALLCFSSLAALLCRLSISRSRRDEFHVLRLCFIS